MYKQDGLFFSAMLAGRLVVMQAAGRFRRMVDRFRSPRRFFTSIMVAICGIVWFGYFLVACLYRTPTDPENLRLWLSGGFFFYSMFHMVRAAWQEPRPDFGLTDVERLWLGTAPLDRSSLVYYRVATLLLPTCVKTMLLGVLLVRDTTRPELALLTIGLALLLMEWFRLLVVSFVAGLSRRGIVWMRIFATSVVVCLAFQVLVRALTTWTGIWDPAAPLRFMLNLFAALGDTAADPTVQWLALPYHPFAYLVTVPTWGFGVLLTLVIVGIEYVLIMGLMLRVDRWALRQSRSVQQQQMACYRNGKIKPFSGSEQWLAKGGQRGVHGTSLLTLGCLGEISPLVARQWVTLRRYWAMVFISLAIPSFMASTPLWLERADDRVILEIIGGLTLYTLLLAPPAMKVDFRRDVNVLGALAMLPLRPATMVIGQIALPVFVTVIFQLTVVFASSLLRPVSLVEASIWGATLAGVAVFAFALENFLFLSFPHHLNQEGLEMMVRAKLMFVGKGVLWGAGILLMILWSQFCEHWFPKPFQEGVLFFGIVLGTWGVAIATVLAAAGAWRRFDVQLDVPAA